MKPTQKLRNYQNYNNNRGNGMTKRCYISHLVAMEDSESDPRPTRLDSMINKIEIIQPGNGFQIRCGLCISSASVICSLFHALLVRQLDLLHHKDPSVLETLFYITSIVIVIICIIVFLSPCISSVSLQSIKATKFYIKKNEW